MKANFAPINPLVVSMLNDLYQIKQAYAHWLDGRHNELATFDLFFREEPFGGKFAIYGGLEAALRLVNAFRFNKDDVAYLKQIPSLSDCKPGFFDWLKSINCSGISIHALKEGEIVFPRVPLVRVKGPIGVAQLLETPLLNQTGFASLITTNAARFKLAAGKEKIAYEYGLRRAQGADGGVSAAYYAYMGGFDGTSNILAGKLYGIPVGGTMAHAYVQSFSGIDDLTNRELSDTNGKKHDFVEIVLKIRKELGYARTNESELAAFISFAQAFPKGFTALVDTYNTLQSGVPNFVCVAVALIKLGYKPLGLRIDSDDLAEISKKIRKILETAGQSHNADLFKQTIIASNSINEKVLHEFNRQGNEINAYGIGENLVTCQAQPSFGVVYKLVEIGGKPRIKLSEGKATIPGEKEAYRLFGQNDKPLVDLMIRTEENTPTKGRVALCRHPFEEFTKEYVRPSRVKKLHHLVWDKGNVTVDLPSLEEKRNYALKQLESLGAEHIRNVNPTPYRVRVSNKLYSLIHSLRKKETQIPEIS